MFPALQPHRPQHPPPRTANAPASQQQTRSANTMAFGTPLEHDRSGVASPLSSLPQYKPGSQIEAMPPHHNASPVPTNPAMQPFNSATRHPVFFTPDLRKPPFPMPAFPASGFHPVATGYVFEQSRVAPSAAVENWKNKL